MPDTPQPATVRAGIAERLSRMIVLPTVSAELAERGLAPFTAFEELLSELYPLIHAQLEREKITDLGIVYRWRGRTSGDPVVLMAHYDVVPVDESDAWTHPPFSGTISDGNVYGRGALDDKGPFVVLADAVENLLADGFTPARDVYLVFGGNEESHGSAVRAVAGELKSRGIVPWLVLDEGGAVVDSPLPFVSGQLAMIGVAEKGVLTLTLSARGTGGHASTPPSMTAVRRVARAVDRLSPGTFRPHTPLAIRRLMQMLAPHATGPGRLLYRFLGAQGFLTARVLTRVGTETAALVRTTVAATMSAGGTAANVIPSQASATINLRIALGETVAGTVSRVRRRIADRHVEVAVFEGDDPTPESPVDGAPFALLTAAVAASYPQAETVPYVVMAATDSRHFHRYSPAVYRFAPIAMSTAQRAAIHGVDEWVEIESLERGERFHRALLERIPAA